MKIVIGNIDIIILNITTLFPKLKVQTFIIISMQLKIPTKETNIINIKNNHLLHIGNVLVSSIADLLRLNIDFAFGINVTRPSLCLIESTSYSYSFLSSLYIITSLFFDLSLFNTI